MSDQQPPAGGEGAAARPVLRVVRGRPTPEELAVLVTVLAGAGSASAPSGPQRPASAWNDRSRGVRAPLSPGPNAWRASALPS